MELSSHLINTSAFDSEHVNEMALATLLVEKTQAKSLIMFDKSFYSLGLLHDFQQAGETRLWLLKTERTEKSGRCRHPRQSHCLGNDISELYRNRWDIVKSRMLDNSWTLRSRVSELVVQELWSVC